MRKKIETKCPLRELHEVFNYSEEELEAKRARLFPYGQTGHEMHTVSIFLASLSAVKEYRKGLFDTLGVKKINLQTAQLHVFTEIGDKKLKVSKGEDRPDGLVVITSGKRDPIIEWSCFIEAKVGNNHIEQPQIDKYVDLAQRLGIDSIVTISNQLVTTPFDTPVKTRKRSISLFHWSWAYLTVFSSRLVKTNMVKDEDHVFVLKELRRYFDSHKHVSNYTDMGSSWKESVTAIHLHEDRKLNKQVVGNIVSAYLQEEKDLSLQLTDRTGILVQLMSLKGRSSEVEKMLCSDKVISSLYCLNEQKNCNFSVDVNFAKQTITCRAKVAIEGGKAQAQTTALIKMLSGQAASADEILINAVYLRNRSGDDFKSLSELSRERNEGSTYYSILKKEYGEQVREFEVKIVASLGRDFSSAKRFIVRIELLAEVFLQQVMGNIPEKFIKSC